jgi:hypothetical protein
MESIQQLIGHLERNPQWQAQAQFRRIVALWPTVVGPAVSQHSRPTGLQQQVLQVAVSSAAWAQTLTLERLTILQKLRDRLPADSQPRDLRFSPGRWASAPQGIPLGSWGLTPSAMCIPPSTPARTSIDSGGCLQSVGRAVTSSTGRPACVPPLPATLPRHRTRPLVLL